MASASLLNRENDPSKAEDPVDNRENYSLHVSSGGRVKIKRSQSLCGVVISWFRSDLWLLEILSLLITFISFSCLVVLLHRVNRKPLPHWPSGLTVNTVVSWIATVLETTLLLPVGSCISQDCWLWFNERARPLADVNFFDKAARSAWGSLKLLCRLRGIYLACLGSFITIVALGLDPFFQQTINYPSRLVGSSNSTAQVVFAQFYDGQVSSGAGGELATAFVHLPSNLKSAIYSGLWASEDLSPPSPLFSCSSGTCTWPLFSSLAANLVCEDIASKVKLNCSELSAADLWPPGTTACNFIAPDDSMLNQTLTNSTPNTFFALNSLQEDIVRENWDNKMRNHTGLIAGIQWVKALSNFLTREDYKVLQLVGPNTTWEAKQCTLYFGVAQLRASVSGGNYFEEVVDEYSWNGVGTVQPVDQEPLVLTPPFANGQSFNISGLAFESIASEYLMALGQNFVTTGSSTGFDVSNPSGNQDLVLRLWNAQNITRILQNMNTYVTNSLRGNQSALLPPGVSGQSTIDPETSINGTVWIKETFIEVAWAWLLMPFVLTILVGMLLFLTMLRSSLREVGVWKSSPLAFMLHGIPDGEQRRYMRTTASAGAGEMDSRAEEVKVRLAADDDGMLSLLPSDRLSRRL